MRRSGAAGHGLVRLGGLEKPRCDSVKERFGGRGSARRDVTRRERGVACYGGARSSGGLRVAVTFLAAVPFSATAC